jgi:hypothetical protein
VANTHASTNPCGRVVAEGGKPFEVCGAGIALSRSIDGSRAVAYPPSAIAGNG